MAGLEYIKAALVDGDTVVKGGLILSTLIALRNDKGNVTAGINGADTKENGIALWLGGKAIDKQASTTTEEEKKIAAKSLLRFDGTGYFADGNLWWDADGTLHADPTSFIINENNIGVQLAFFAPVWKSGTTDATKLANVLFIDPQKPFTHLGVSGNVTTEGSLKIGGIYLSYDSANNALRLSKDAAGKEAANFYATGGITAYGAGASTTGGGGGLNGSVKSYSSALMLTSESLSEIATAYSIKALDSRISSLEGGSATAISVSGSGNAVTSVTKNGTTISVVKGSKFLTSHQSLVDYVSTISVSGSGNAITSVSKSGNYITFTKGATFLTSHQSLADYAKKSEIPTKVSQLTNDTGYITSSGSCAYATSAGNADTVDGYHATSGRTFDGNINWSSNWNNAWSDGTNKHPWYGFDHRYPNTGAYSTTITDYFGMTIKTFNTLRLDFGTLLLNGTDIHNINVASATKLATARSIWGQSFDGTGNVNGTIYINNSNSSNGAIRLNSNISSNARISAIDDQVIFNTGNAIRFGETAWDWDKWAGLKYNHSDKTIYLGIADNSVFNANSAQSNGTLRLAGITTISPDSGARIATNSNGSLYLGNANNNGWVYTQDICSQTSYSFWSIRQSGAAYFNSININGAATINGTATINGNLSVT